MQFRPGLRAFSTGFLILFSTLYTLMGLAGLLILHIHYIFLAHGIITLGVLLVLSSIFVRLVVLSGPKLVGATISNVLSTMQIQSNTVGSSIVLDRSGIQIKVISIGFISLVVLRGGTNKSRTYLASVIKKFINYRHS